MLFNGKFSVYKKLTTGHIVLLVMEIINIASMLPIITSFVWKKHIEMRIQFKEQLN